MTLPLLLLNDSGVGQSSDDITRPAAIYASLESNLPKNCLHIEEYRQFLRSGGNASNLRRPLKGRCDHIYFMQSKAVSNIACPRRRVSCMYDAYVSGTVIPLVEANVRSDNGEMGGSEPRLAVLSEVAGSPAPDSDRGSRCWIMHKFTEGLHTLLQNFPGAAETVNRHRGGLHSAESLLYLIHQTKNMNGNLKPDNQRMNFMLADSDVGFYLNGLGSQFEMAKNFIGLTLWCQNCNGNADTREKTRGTGLFVCCLLLFGCCARLTPHTTQASTRASTSLSTARPRCTRTPRPWSTSPSTPTRPRPRARPARPSSTSTPRPSPKTASASTASPSTSRICG